MSKRSLRPDPNFDALISKIYPCRDEYEAHQERVLARIKQSINPSSMAQNVEEGLRQQAMNRAQRVKKQIQGDFSDDGSLPTHPRLADVSSLTADNSSSEDQLAGGSQVAEASCLASEIELVMRPHPQLSKHDIYDSQTRFIKTTSNATGIKLSAGVLLIDLCLCILFNRGIDLLIP